MDGVLCLNILDNKNLIQNPEELRNTLSDLPCFGWIHDIANLFIEAKHVYFITPRPIWLIDVNINWLHLHLPWLNFFEIIHLEYEKINEIKIGKLKEIKGMCLSHPESNIIFFDNDQGIVKEVEKISNIIQVRIVKEGILL